MNMKPGITRRRLIAGAAGFGAGMLLLPKLNARAYAANEKLNLALVGCGNRGGNLLDRVFQIGENLVGLCDVNQQRAAKTFQKAPDVPKHFDFEFPARGDLPPVTLHWFKGDEAPGFLDKIQQLTGREAGGSGCLVVGTRGRYLASGHNSAYSLLPHGSQDPVRRPDPYLPRHGSHEREWLDAIRGKVPQPMSNFDVAGREIETLMLGNVATMLGREIEYDPVRGTCPGDDQATAALDREHREGWKLRAE